MNRRSSGPGERSSKTTGDGVYAAFARASEALEAALASQLRLAGEGPPVRMAVHTGWAEARDGDYMSPTLNRTARLLETAHGGQVILSLATEELARDALPSDAGVKDLGQHRLRDLANPEQVFQLIHPDLRESFPDLRTLEARPHNLPLHLTSFVGRQRELDEVEAALEGNRLVTLVGVGGSGKTRLSLQAAARAVERFPHGVWLVELAQLSDPDLIPQVVAGTLGIPEQPGRPLLEVLADALSARCLLLLLDNCEHLIGGAATVADRLLRAVPKLTILATSREGLGIGGEVLWQVPPLDSSSEAVHLFMERARAVKPGFEPEEEHELIGHICRRLDGMPLAIELAAARLRSMSVAQIAGRLDDRFRLLTGGSRTAVPRQQTLEAAVEWSHQILPEPEQLLFRRLAVFPGDFTLEAAESVCGVDSMQSDDVMDLLSHLVDKSLVVSRGDRYLLLETIRTYARAKLTDSGEGDAIRERHARHYRELMEDADRRRMADQDFFELAERERDNLRSAFDWLEGAGRAGEASKLLIATTLLWLARGVDEGHRRAERLIEGGHLEPGQLAQVRALLGYLLGLQGEMESAVEIGRQALGEARTSGDQHALALALEVVASFDRADPTRSLAAAREALGIWEEIGDPFRVARLHFTLGLSAKYRGDYQEAVDWIETGLTDLRKQRHPWHTAWALVNLGQLARYLGAIERSAAYIDEALGLMRETGDRRGMAAAEEVMARFLWEVDRRDEAWDALHRSLTLAQEAGSRIELARALDLTALFVAGLEDHGRAARLLAAAESLVPLSSRWPPADQAWVEETAGGVRQALGPEEFHQAWAQGSSFTLDDAVRHAFGA